MAGATHEQPPLTGIRVLEFAGLAPGSRAANAGSSTPAIKANAIVQVPLQAFSSPTTAQPSSVSTVPP